MNEQNSEPPFNYPIFCRLKGDLYVIAELTLRQVILVTDLMEENQFRLSNEIRNNCEIARDVIQKTTTNSHLAVKEVSRHIHTQAGQEGMKDLLPAKGDPIKFILSGVRIVGYLERILNLSSECHDFYARRNITQNLFAVDKTLIRILSRLVTGTGMIVEFFVEEKDRFYGSLNKIAAEIRRHCLWYFGASVKNHAFGKREFADLSFILHNFLVMSGDFISISRELRSIYSKSDSDI